MHLNTIKKLSDVNIITSSGQINKQAAKMILKYPELSATVVNSTNFLPAETPIRIRLCCILQNIKKPPTCVVCNAPTTFNKSKGTFNKYCANLKNRSCASKDKRLQDKRRETNIKKYGVDNPLKSSDIREKIYKTNIKKYGHHTPSSNSNVKAKIQQTCFKKYGVDNISKNVGVQARRNSTLTEKYGTSTYAQSLITEESLLKLKSRDWLYEQHHTKNKTLTYIAKLLGVSVTTVSRYCKLHNIEVHQISSVSNTSIDENAIKQYVQNLNTADGDVILNDRKLISPYELDILIPTNKLAIEYCGVYWHSELTGNRDKNYHLHKHQLCAKQNIRLIQIWSTEWLFKQDIVKSRLSSAFGKNKTIYARKCEVVELTYPTAKKFLQRTHIQGPCAGSVYLGLYCENVLVGVMVFGINRFSKTKPWELIRYSSELFTNVIGGASKLFKHFINRYNPTTVVSYSDIRWNTGSLYNMLGFNHIQSTAPNYWYFKVNGQTDVLYNRVNFQKHRLVGKLDMFDTELSEWDNMINNGYDRIWDCGNTKWEWKA